MVTKYYYWRKYELTEEWVDSEPDEYIDVRTSGTSSVSREHHKDWEVFDMGEIYDPDYYTTEVRFMNLEFKVREISGGYELALAGDSPKIKSYSTERPTFNFPATFDHGLYYTGWYSSSQKVYYRQDGHFLEADINWFKCYDRMWDSSFYRWVFTKFGLENIKRLTLGEKTQWKVRTIGDWLETVLAPAGTYPTEGEQGGYWWVRGEEYTIEIPELIYPENGAEFMSGPDYFEFELKRRMNDCPGNYHARLRVGTRSDFNRKLFFADTTKSSDRGDFEYWDGSAWVSFPSGGVDGDTRVRYTVPGGVSWQPFTIYYWDALAYNANFGYSPPARFRSLLNMGATSDFYLLLINGIPYKANGLKLVESSNGRVGRMDIKLLNY